MIQKTLVVLKPDTVGRSLIGEIISRFERVGLKLCGIKMLQPDREFYFHHYETIGQMVSRRGQKVFDMTLDYLNAGPVVAMVWEGVEAVALVRKLVWSTQASEAAPGTIRGDYSHMTFDYADKINHGLINMIHASGDADEAKLEIEHWFKPEEIYEYDLSNKRFMHGK
jgi:nucleoside-diphosphate kinase